MSDHSTEILKAIHEIRDLVRLMAEPALAERDKRLRGDLRRIIGNSKPKADAVLLMDGTRTQRAIHKETGINEGNLSTLVKQLKNAKLLVGEGKQLKLTISVPKDFFEKNGVNGE